MNFGWFLVGFLILAVFERQLERRFSQHAVRGERKMGWSSIALYAGHALIYVATAGEFFLVRRDIRWPVTAVAVGLVVVSLVVRSVAIRTLGKFWSLHLEIRAGHQLVTGGIYRYLRHPAYAAIMLEVTAIPLVANAWYTLAFALLVYVPVLLLRWRQEEREMIGKFGQQYVEYARRVPAFFPLRWPRQGS